MSITIDYFFNYPETMEQTAEDINTWIGSRLEPYQGDPSDLFCRFLGMEFSLSEHTMKDDGELDFQTFQYEIGTRTPAPEADFRLIQLPVMAFLAFALYRKLGITGILVYDGQRLLARYVERGDSKTGSPGLFDTISDKFVTFPSHLADLGQLMPENEWLLTWERGVKEHLKAKGHSVERPNAPHGRSDWGGRS